MNLLDRFLKDKNNRKELNQKLCDFLFKQHQEKGKSIARFCEHDGISIWFTPAHTSWHANAPCALKPWWLFLKPVKTDTIMNNDALNKNINAITKTTRTKTATTKIIEVTKNA